MRRRAAAMFAAALLFLPGTSSALAADIGAIKKKAEVCVACHGADGNSANPVVPSLAGQPKQFITTQLVMFREGNRKDPQMSPMAANLSNADINDFGTYFSAQKPAPPTQSTVPDKVAGRPPRPSRTTAFPATAQRSWASSTSPGLRVSSVNTSVRSCAGSKRRHPLRHGWQHDLGGAGVVGRGHRDSGGLSRWNEVSATHVSLRYEAYPLVICCMRRRADDGVCESRLRAANQAGANTRSRTGAPARSRDQRDAHRARQLRSAGCDRQRRQERHPGRQAAGQSVRSAQSRARHCDTQSARTTRRICRFRRAASARARRSACAASGSSPTAYRQPCPTARPRRRHSTWARPNASK